MKQKIYGMQFNWLFGKNSEVLLPGEMKNVRASGNQVCFPK
jgi:hypothetical protein